MNTPAGGVQGGVRMVLRTEGLLVLACAVWLFAYTGVSWWTFGLLLFAPDVALLGYLAGSRVGGLLYNSLHSYIGPLALAAAAGGEGLGFAVALIWAAHCGLDRALGYGLKYASGFGHTHLGPIGRAR